MNNDDVVVYTIDEVAKILRVSDDTIRRMITAVVKSLETCMSKGESAFSRSDANACFVTLFAYQKAQPF